MQEIQLTHSINYKERLVKHKPAAQIWGIGLGFLGIFALIALITMLYPTYLGLPSSLNCANSQFDILVTPPQTTLNFDTNTSFNVIWQRQLTARDALFTTSSEELVFHRGYDSTGCSEGDQIISLDTKTGEQLWESPAELVRAIVPSPDEGFLVAKCCTSLMKLDNKGEIIWESEEFPVKTFEPKINILGGKVYFQLDSETPIFSLENGTLLDTLNDQEVFAISDNLLLLNVVGVLAARVNSDQKFDWIFPLEHPEAASSYQIYRYGDILLVVLSYYHIDALSVKTGEKLWEINKEFDSIPILFNDTIIGYTQNNELEFYDVQTGILSQKLQFQRTPTSNSTPSFQESHVQLTTASNQVFLFFGDSAELLALDLSDENS